MQAESKFIEPADSSLVEGVGDEVIVALVFGFIAVLLALAWLSTNLTNTQTRLTSVRVHRRGITLNRLPGSSTSEIHASQQRATTSQESATPTTTSNLSGSIAEVDALAEAISGSSDAVSPGVVVIDPVENLASNIGARAETVSTETAEASSEPTVTDSTAASPADSPVADDLAAEAGTRVNSEPISGTPIINTVGSNDSNIPVEESESSGPATETASTSQEQSNQREPAVDIAANTPQESSTEEDPVIRIRIKFLSDHEKLVQARGNETIAGFKQCHFATELSNNKLVRLIFNGQVLLDDRTLLSYSITDNTTIHALISEPSAATLESPSQPTIVVFNAGVLMVPLFTIILGILWYVRYEFPGLFNITSTMSLVSITSVFLYCVYASRQTRPVQGSRHRRYGLNVTPSATTTN